MKNNETSYNIMAMNVKYNRLNLPDSVSFPSQGNTMKLEYLADGRRVRTTARTYGTPLVLPGGGSTPQNPVNVLEEIRDGELVFRDGQLVELRTDGGYFSLYNDSLSTTQVRPYFYVTDYLGSVRMVCDGITGAVRQSLEFLPSGEVFRADNYPEQSYMFCGKELMTMHGWNMYDSNARFQHSRQPRFSSLDPLAEKYYNLSPYNYAGNDFVNLVDYGGDSIVMRTPDSNGEYHNYTFDLQRFGFYDSNGNALYNDASRKVLRAFSELMKGKRGTRLVSDLSSMEECVLIEVAVGEPKNIEADWTSEGFHSAVRWFPEAETLDGLPSFISLAHELAHSEDRLNGTLDSSTWFITESNNGISKRVPKAEIYSTFVENQIRAEHNIPLRTHYACDANGRWIGGQVIRNNASLYFDKSGNHRPNYSKIKKTNRYVF